MKKRQVIHYNTCIWYNTHMYLARAAQSMDARANSIKFIEISTCQVGLRHVIPSCIDSNFRTKSSEQFFSSKIEYRPKDWRLLIIILPHLCSLVGPKPFLALIILRISRWIWLHLPFHYNHQITGNYLGNKLKYVAIVSENKNDKSKEKNCLFQLVFRYNYLRKSK